MKKTSQQVTYWMGVVALGLVIGVGAQFAQAWTAPSGAPPTGNVQGPLNISNVAQEKAGSLTVQNSLMIKPGAQYNAPHLQFNRSGGVQDIYADGSSALVYTSAHNSASQLIFRDRQETEFGRVYGTESGSGRNHTTYIGFLDGDKQWTMMAATDKFIQFKLNNKQVMMMSPTGLGVNGKIRTDSTQPSDHGSTVVTKDYVDNLESSGGGDNLGNHRATQNLVMSGKKVQWVANPTSPTDAANKAYVDAKQYVAGDTAGLLMAQAHSNGSVDWGNPTFRVVGMCTPPFRNCPGGYMYGTTSTRRTNTAPNCPSGWKRWATGFRWETTGLYYQLYTCVKRP